MLLLDIIRAIRRNHALEHATIAVLTSRLGRDVPMVGRATRNGFYLYGDLPPERVKEAAVEALYRLRRGERHLAISSLCGTNLAVAGIMAGISSLLALGNRSRLERLPNVLLASMLAVLAAQPVGRFVQQHITTDPELTDVELVAISTGGRGPGKFHRIETASNAHGPVP